MSVQVADINVSAAVANQVLATIDWSGYIPARSQTQMDSSQPGAYGYLRIFNESGCGLNLQFNGNSGQRFVPAGGWIVYPLHEDDTKCVPTVSYVLANQVVSQVFAIYYRPGEPVDGAGTLGNSPIGVSSVTTTSLYPVNDTAHFMTLVWAPAQNELFIEPNGPASAAAGFRLTYLDASGNIHNGIELSPVVGGAVTILPALTLTNALASIDGEAVAVGAIGVPVVDALTQAQHIVATGLTTIMTVTPAATGLYRVSGYARINNGTSPNNVNFKVQYTDPDSGGATGVSFLSALTGAFMTGSNSIANGAHAIVPVTFRHTGGQAVTVSYNDPTNTPSDFVSAFLERIA